MINYRFIIKTKLGEGRSKVFLCSDVDNPEKELAIKVLPVTEDKDEIKTFRDEFFTLQKLNHPNIITSHEEGIVVTDYPQWDIKTGSRFIILEYFPGSELLKYEKLNDERNLKIILNQVCSVLYYLHQSNYVYYDLKPENILVAEAGGKPVIKLIDMGFANHSSFPERNLTRGTTEYIAPEILKNENHNHQVDLYSLGIMLYRIIYGKFPFNSESMLDIYKEHIEREFEFPESNFSFQLIEVSKKLLAKSPLNRYTNSLQVLRDLELNLDENIIKDFTPANVFADREDVTTQINNFLIDKESHDVLLISGVEGSGKTSLIYKIYSAQERIVVLSNYTGKSGLGFVHYLLKSIISSEFIHSFLSRDIIEQAESILTNNIDNLVTGLKSIITKVSAEVKFILVIDDFNLLDDFTLDVCVEILPILQVNGIKIILAERSDHTSSANKIINKIVEVNLSPFTDEGLSEYLNEAFASFFPKDQLKKLIVKYADLLPGSIVSFVRDLILLNIIRFTYDGSEIVVDEKTEKLLEGSHEEIFRHRLSLLTDVEIKLVQFISSFENTPDVKVISVLNDLPPVEIYKIMKSLEEKNILQESKVVNAITFTSDSLKKYVYSIIKEKEGYHLKTARVISENFKSFNRQELAKQYELGKDFIATYNILSEEVNEADRLFAYSYKRNILNHLLKFPLPENYITELNYKLSLTLYKLNDTKSALKIIEDLLKKVNDEKLENDLLILKGSCLIELGEEVEEGKNLLNDLLIKIKDEKRKQQLKVEIAYAEFDLNKYDVAKEICYEIINNINSSPEDKGKCYNLLGLIDTYLESDFDCALNNFQNALEMYKSAKLTLNVAKIEVNIGNTYFWKMDYVNAEKHWNSALQSNLSIGNLDQEAKTLLSFGIFNYNKLNFANAIEQYKRANNIFESLGNRNGQGLVLINLGEIYLSSCEYQSAFESLNKAKDVFRLLLNTEEEAEALFMLGKFFFILGDEEQLKLTMNDIESLVKKNLLPERYSNNFKYLELVYSVNEKKYINDLDFVKDVLNVFKEQNDGLFFAESYSILCENLIYNGMYEMAYNMLNDNKFTKICNENFLYKAEKKYLESLLASSSGNFRLPLPIKSLEEAHSLINDELITELTWKVLYFLGEHYFDRGNLSKAGDYLKYSKEVINFIAQNINDENMRISYLSKPERNSILRKIEIMENKF